LPGVREVHAVDETGVHPLLLAIGSERYVPYARERTPMEVLTQASAILGQGQMSLAKYLFVTASEDAPALSTHDVGAYFEHVLERVDPTRDLHFWNNTTIDTLDYSGSGLNQGSKVVIAAVGAKRRSLGVSIPPIDLPTGFTDPRVAMKGVLVVSSPSPERDPQALDRFVHAFTKDGPLASFPLVVLVDDAEFSSRSLANFLFTTFTRSNPAVDIRGIEEFVRDKAWGCRGSIVIDARSKAHHAPVLIEDPKVEARVSEVLARHPKLRAFA
jgi:4-hydroxy-3-polyprenylbenzoate decarboxylase